MTRTAARPWWPLLGVLTLLTYNTWVLWGPLNGHAAIFNGYLSELSAKDQPHHLFFRGGDLLTSLIVGALGLRALRVWPRLSPDRRRWWVVAAAALILFGVSTFLDSFFAMDCSPTLNEQCKVLEETGRLSATHYAHTFTSVGAQIGIVTSMVATYIAMRRSRLGAHWQHLLLVASVLEVVALTVMMAMLALGVPGLGYPQAVMVVVGSLWFASVGIALYRDGSALPGTPAPRTEDLYAG
ncbi:MAG: DUF998 domain-containing protein [Propionibacteriaceae bacterium]